MPIKIVSACVSYCLMEPHRRQRWRSTRPISAASGIGSAKPKPGEQEAPRTAGAGPPGVEAAVDYYTREAGLDVALVFIEALETAYRTIADRPAAGSPRYAHELAIPGLRSRRLRRYPYLMFYIERDDHIDVWRVLHARRDIPDSMQEPEV